MRDPVTTIALSRASAGAELTAVALSASGTLAAVIPDDGKEESATGIGWDLAELAIETKALASKAVRLLPDVIAVSPLKYAATFNGEGVKEGLSSPIGMHLGDAVVHHVS